MAKKKVDRHAPDYKEQERIDAIMQQHKRKTAAKSVAGTVRVGCSGYGSATRTELIRVGHSESAIDHAVERGYIVQQADGSYTLPATAPASTKKSEYAPARYSEDNSSAVAFRNSRERHRAIKAGDTGKPHWFSQLKYGGTANLFSWYLGTREVCTEAAKYWPGSRVRIYQNDQWLLIIPSAILQANTELKKLNEMNETKIA